MDKELPGLFQIQDLFILALRLLDSVSMIAVLILFGLIVAGLCVGFVATAKAPVGYQDETGFAKAPVGYQDETGFHFGRQDAAGEEAFVCGLAQPKPA
jgi:hypothetical protein